MPELPLQSRDGYPTPGTPLSEYPRTPELYRQSWDCPGIATQPLGPLCQSIPERRSYPGSPGIVPGWLPNPGDPSGRVSQNTGVTLAVPGLSRDDYPTPGTCLPEYPRMPELNRQSRDDYPTLGPPCQSIPEHRSYTSSPGIVLGWLPNPWDLSARVSQNAGVTPAVRDCPGMTEELGSHPIPGQSQDCRCNSGVLTEWLGSHPGTIPGLPV